MSPKTTLLLAACLLAGVGGAHARDATTPSSPSAAHARSAGENTFGKWCSDCHSTVDGPGSMALQRRYRGDPPAVLEQRHDLTPEYVSQVVRHGMSFMPSFRKTEISDADLALLAAYLAPVENKRK